MCIIQSVQPLTESQQRVTMTLKVSHAIFQLSTFYLFCSHFFYVEFWNGSLIICRDINAFSPLTYLVIKKVTLGKLSRLQAEVFFSVLCKRYVNLLLSALGPYFVMNLPRTSSRAYKRLVCRRNVYCE